MSDNRYPTNLINNEKEVIKFTEVYTSSTITQDTIRLNRQLDNEQLLDKYTFSNALALSVKLGRVRHVNLSLARLLLVRLTRHMGNVTRRRGRIRRRSSQSAEARQTHQDRARTDATQKRRTLLAETCGES